MKPPIPAKIKVKPIEPMAAERAMRQADRRTGHKITVTYNTTTNQFLAHAYRSHAQAVEYVRATITESVSLSELTKLNEDATRIAIAFGVGKTIVGAMANLMEKLAPKH